MYSYCFRSIFKLLTNNYRKHFKISKSFVNKLKLLYINSNPNVLDKLFWVFFYEYYWFHLQNLKAPNGVRYVNFTRTTLSPIVTLIAQKTVRQKFGVIVHFDKMQLLVFSIVTLVCCTVIIVSVDNSSFFYYYYYFRTRFHVRSQENGGFRLTFALGVDAMVRARQVLDQVVRQVAFAERHVVDFHRPGGQLQQGRRIMRHVAYEPHHQRVVTQAQLESQTADPYKNYCRARSFLLVSWFAANNSPLPRTFPP